MSGADLLDTIVAPATPVGKSALAIVRIDGPLGPEILHALTGREIAPRTATLLKFRDGAEMIDEGIAVRYAAPESFTGNDTVELTLHGNPMLVQRVLAACVTRGARLAEPGEFTERAVLNGKLDLVQAEAIGDLIAARTPLQARLSLQNLDGHLSRTATGLRETLLFVISRLEAALDFSDEGYEFIRGDEVREKLDGAIAACAGILDTYQRGSATAHGISAVILGAPNAGKSTLLNRLVGSDRAIVTPIPGTTRDIVRETIEIGGLPVTLSDTAGLRESEDVVESIGVVRAREAARDADLILYLIDASRGAREDDERELVRLGRPDALKIYTKTDLAPAPDGEIAISVAADRGVDALMAALDALVQERFVAPEAAPSIVNVRQRAAVAAAMQALEEARATLDARGEEQLVLVDLYRSADELAHLVGAMTRDEILGEIFSSFCIGK